MIRVALELDPLFKIDQVKLHFLRITPEREIRDDDVKERRFSRARLSRDERVLAGSLAEREVLQLRRPAAPDGNAKFLRGIDTPAITLFRSDKRKRNLDAVGIAIGLPEPMDPAHKDLRRRRGEQSKGGAFDRILPYRKTLINRAETEAGVTEILHRETLRHLGAFVPMDEEKNPAPRP